MIQSIYAGGGHMSFEFRKAVKEDLDLLLKTRVEMLKAVGGAPEGADFSEMAEHCRAYYIKSFEKDIHVAYLAFDVEAFIGCGGISFYQITPSYRNPTGMKAYIMNIYTVPKYRGQSIATQIVHLLVQEAYKRDIRQISLDATDMGRPVYERYGFVPAQNTMKLEYKENPMG